MSRVEQNKDDGHNAGKRRERQDAAGASEGGRSGWRWFIPFFLEAVSVSDAPPQGDNRLCVCASSPPTP